MSSLIIKAYVNQIDLFILTRISLNLNAIKLKMIISNNLVKVNISKIKHHVEI